MFRKPTSRFFSEIFWKTPSTPAKTELSDDKKIIVRAELTENSLCVAVDNTYTGTLKHSGTGKLISTKHSGIGLGTQSVKSIAEKYGGVCRFETEDGMFCASVLISSK